MKASELRIGNWVRYKDSDRIKPERRGQDYQIIADDISAIQEGFNVVEPVTLSEKWLDKFGFGYRLINGIIPEYSIICTPKGYKKEMELYFWFGAFKTTLKGVCDQQGWRPYNESGTSHNFSIQYIHQLQNLYFALTGEELTIKNLNQ